MAQIDTLTNVGAVVSTDLALILRGGANVLGTFGSLVGQNATSVTITGGTINGTTIGATTPASVAATTLTTTGAATFSGTVTADGLTVDGGGSLTFSELTSKIAGPLNQDFIIQQRGNADTEALRIQNVDNNNLAKFDKNGDISFYDDSGNAKFFWDASAESLGIGDTTFAAGKLQVYDSSGNHVWLKGRASDGTSSVSFRNNADNTYNGRIQVADTGGMLFQVAGSTRATIDASGNVIFVASGGAIKSIGGDVSLVQGAVGLRINDAGLAISPTTSSANSDAAVDLGVSNIRFKDLYLSGGVSTNTATGLSITADSSNRGILNLSTSTAYQLIGGSYYGYTGYKTGGYHRWFGSDGNEDMRIDASGNLLVGKTGSNLGVAGVELRAGTSYFTNSAASPMAINRESTDGQLIGFYNDETPAGDISVSGTTVSYNAFMGSHYTETVDTGILFGTVMEVTGELVDQNYAVQERLSKVKVSDTAESKNVYGVWIGGYEGGGETVAALGASWCRIALGVTLELGDLLVSNGDGTAKVQSDDIIRSMTIGKVTSTTIKETHADGSYVVPVVLYCG